MLEMAHSSLVRWLAERKPLPDLDRQGRGTPKGRQ
jgi:hypothetical protein